jgi:hypothetical protein
MEMSPERPTLVGPSVRHLPRALADLAGVAFCAWLALRWGLAVARPLLDGQGGHDFAIFRASALALLGGGDPYNLPPALDPSLNHPAVTLWAVPFALPPPPLGYALWIAAACVAYLLALVGAVRIAGLPRAIWCHPVAIVLAIGYAGFGAALVQGQISPFLLVPLVLAWGAYRRGQVLSAAALCGALIALKLTFLPLAALFLVRRAPREIGALAAGGFAVSLAALPFVGVEGYRHWLALLGAVDFAALNTTNMSLTGLLYRVTPDAPRVLANLGIAAACLAGLVVARAGAPRGWHPADWRVGALLLLSLLASPIAWDHYGPFLLPVAAGLLAARSRLARPARFAALAGALCLLDASGLRLLARLAGAAPPALGTILCAGLLLALAAHLIPAQLVRGDEETTSP